MVKLVCLCSAQRLHIRLGSWLGWVGTNLDDRRYECELISGT